MGCLGDREDGPPEHTAKWEFINLSDFHSLSVLTALAYAWLWFMALVGVAVYAVDTFTAINLLFFNHWSSSVKPKLDYKYSRWIFAACILFSWVLCFYQWFRAIRVIKRGGVAESYMDPLAAALQSMRSQGWRRFLVFKELTKSKKGKDYVALFVYFAFQGAVRIIVAEGPRQAINAMTLYAVLQADVLPAGHDDHPAVIQFFLNIQALAEKNNLQAVIYFSMLFTLVIWVFSALSLITALVLYLLYLWHSIPQEDGRLSVYCRRKIDRRLARIVEVKVKAGLEEEERRKQKMERKAELKRQRTGELPPPGQPQPGLVRQPTLPQLMESESDDEDKKQPGFPLSRQDSNTSQTTLPPYTSRAPTRNGSYDSQAIPGRPGMLSRSGTEASGWSSTSYASDAPLLANAGHAGYGGNGDRLPALPPSAFSRQDSAASSRRPMQNRTMSQSTHGSQHPFSPLSRMDSQGPDRPYSPMSRNDSNYSRAPPRLPLPVRSNTATSFDQQSTSTSNPFGPPSRQNTFDSAYSQQTGRHSPAPTLPRQPTVSSMQSARSFSRPMPARQPSQATSQRPYSPAPAPTLSTSSADSYEMTSQPSRAGPSGTPGNPYVAFKPSTPAPQSNSGFPVAVAGAPGTANNYFGHVRPGPQRSATAPIDEQPHAGYAGVLDDYGPVSSSGIHGMTKPPGPAGLPRSATAQPSNDGWPARF